MERILVTAVMQTIVFQRSKLEVFQVQRL